MLGQIMCNLLSTLKFCFSQQQTELKIYVVYIILSHKQKKVRNEQCSWNNLEFPQKVVDFTTNDWFVIKETTIHFSTF